MGCFGEGREKEYRDGLTADRLACVVDQNHVTRFQQAKVHSQGILQQVQSVNNSSSSRRCTGWCFAHGPKCVWIFRVSHRNVTSQPIGVPLACENTESECHLL